MEIKKVLYLGKENKLIILKPTDETYSDVLDILESASWKVYTDTDYIFALFTKDDENAEIILKSINKYFDTEIWMLEAYKNIYRFKDVIGSNDIYINNLEKYFAQNFSESVNDFSLGGGKVTAWKRGQLDSFVKDYKDDCVLYWLEDRKITEEND